jgi:hypothetical protein
LLELFPRQRRSYRRSFQGRTRALGGAREDRQDLLGHKSDRITTHYGAPDIARLIEGVNELCEQRHTVLRVVATPMGTQESRTKLTQRASTARVDPGE